MSPAALGTSPIPIARVKQRKKISPEVHTVQRTQGVGFQRLGGRPGRVLNLGLSDERIRGNRLQEFYPRKSLVFDSTYFGIPEGSGGQSLSDLAVRGSSIVWPGVIR